MYEIIRAAKDLDVDVEWACARRKAYLAEQIDKLHNQANGLTRLFAGKNEVTRFLFLDSLRYLNSQITRYEAELNSSDEKVCNGRITQADIERARQFPLENLLQNVRNGKTHCISGSHNDVHPSMDIRNGFAYCYSCQWRGGVISVYIKLRGVDFKTAVRALINAS